jgi:hypothetical protein
MTLIEHIEVGSGGAASITFSSIPATYTDLYVVVSGRTTQVNVADNPRIYPNSSSSNLTYRYLRGSGTNAASGTTYLGFVNADSSTSNTFGNWEFYIPNYASSNAKSISSNSVSENNATAAYSAISAILWDDTTAINALQILPQAGGYDWMQYSSFTLYGITAGSDGTTTVS